LELNVERILSDSHKNIFHHYYLKRLYHTGDICPIFHRDVKYCTESECACEKTDRCCHKEYNLKCYNVITLLEKIHENK